MRKVEIRRPRTGDIENLHQFFRIVITDTFEREGLAGLIDDIEAEIDSKKNYLQMDLDTKGEKRYFLIALAENKIIGTIEYGPASKLIQDCTNGMLGNLVEVGTVFVNTSYLKSSGNRRILSRQRLQKCSNHLEKEIWGT